MKFIISIFALFCVSVSTLGQSYTYRPTPYTQPFVQTIFDAASARTYLGVTNGPASTNIALLNGTNTFTGTNTFARGKIRGLTQFRFDTITNGITLTNIGSANVLTNGASWNSASNDTLAFLMPPMTTPFSAPCYAYQLMRRSTQDNVPGQITMYVGQTTNSCTNQVNSVNYASAQVFKGVANNTIAGFQLSGSYTNTMWTGAQIFTAANTNSLNIDFSQSWVAAFRFSENGIGTGVATTQSVNVVFFALGEYTP